MLSKVSDLPARAHIETDDNSLIDSRQIDIILSDGADPAVYDLDAHFIRDLNLHQRVFQCFHGT